MDALLALPSSLASPVLPLPGPSRSQYSVVVVVFVALNRGLSALSIGWFGVVDYDGRGRQK